VPQFEELSASAAVMHGCWSVPLSESLKAKLPGFPILLVEGGENPRWVRAERSETMLPQATARRANNPLDFSVFSIHGSTDLLVPEAGKLDKVSCLSRLLSENCFHFVSNKKNQASYLLLLMCIAVLNKNGVHTHLCDPVLTFLSYHLRL